MLSLEWISSFPVSELDQVPVCQANVWLLNLIPFGKAISRPCIRKNGLYPVVLCSVAVNHQEKWQFDIPVRPVGDYVMCYRVMDYSIESFHRPVSHRMLSRCPDFPNSQNLVCFLEKC